MDTQDIIKIGYRAKIETEAFINRHLNDTAKGWPKICLCGPAYGEYPQGQKIRRRDNIGAISTQ
jgi:hypothetical protein